jgi:alanine racemase
MTATPQAPVRAEIVVDLGAIRHNVARLRELVSADLPAGESPPALMVVVKADGYGHGMVECARAAREAGAEWLGVATADEALTLRAAGDSGRILSWLAVPGEDLGPAIAADVDVSAYPARRDRHRCARCRSGRARAAQGRHRALAWWRAP